MKDNLKSIVLKLMGVWKRPELERIIDNGYKLVEYKHDLLTYQKRDSYIVYDLNQDKIIKGYNYGK